jgi:hypothetical protein
VSRASPESPSDRHSLRPRARFARVLIERLLQIAHQLGVIVTVAMVAVVLMAGVVLVRPGVWVRVTHGAVTVQIALDELIGGGGHGQVSVERTRIAGFDR